MTKNKNLVKIYRLCEGGGTGRRVRLRGVWLIRVGSSPILHTKNDRVYLGRFFVVFKNIKSLFLTFVRCLTKKCGGGV